MTNQKKKSGVQGLVIAIIAVVVIALVMIVPTYNRLAGSRENVNQAYAQVQNVVQRRADLIPNLVNTVKGYTDHESETLTKVTNARAGVQNAKNPTELAEANEALTRAIGDINVVVENYIEEVGYDNVSERFQLTVFQMTNKNELSECIDEQFQKHFHCYNNLKIS